MNKLLYRLVFNKRRGALMAVAEHVSGQGKNGGTGDSGRVHFGVKLATLTVLATTLWVAGFAHAAPIVADPNAAAGKQPSVISSPSGLPVVNIAAPNAAGLSHNQYQQFNVDPSGAILNNAQKLTSTQLGGYINGNPNLGGGAAKTILNEVTSTNPSCLNGYLEVAGQKSRCDHREPERHCGQWLWRDQRQPHHADPPACRCSAVPAASMLSASPRAPLW